MTGAGRYAELASAVRSFKAELIKPEQIERFVESGSLSETVSLLTRGHVTSVDPSDPTPAEAYLVRRVIELAQRLVAYAPHDSRPLIKLFPRRYELECVKGVLRAIFDQLPPEEAVRQIVPVGRFSEERCKELVEGRNPSRVIEAIDDEALKHFLSSRLSGERSSMAAVFSVDLFYYAMLWAATSLPDPLDAQVARGLVGQLIDHYNILSTFRARLVGLDARSTSDLLIQVNYALGHSLNELAESANVQNLVRVIEKTPYANAFEGVNVEDTSVAKVERVLNRSHAVSCLNVFAGSPFNVGLALGFLFLKNYELHDIFTIINGKANNVPIDRVMDSLILRS